MDVCTIPTLTPHTPPPSPAYLFAYSGTFYTTPNNSLILSFYFVHYKKINPTKATFQQKATKSTFPYGYNMMHTTHTIYQQITIYQQLKRTYLFFCLIGFHFIHHSFLLYHFNFNMVHQIIYQVINF